MRKSIPGVLSAYKSNTRFAKQDPTPRTRIPDSFSMIDGFRVWAHSVQMPKHEIEDHVRRASGNGCDHMFAYFTIIKSEHTRRMEAETAD